MLYMCDNYTKESEYDNTQVKIFFNSIILFKQQKKMVKRTNIRKNNDSYKILFGRKKLEKKQK